MKPLLIAAALTFALSGSALAESPAPGQEGAPNASGTMTPDDAVKPNGTAGPSAATTTTVPAPTPPCVPSSEATCAPNPNCPVGPAPQADTNCPSPVLPPKR